MLLGSGIARFLIIIVIYSPTAPLFVDLDINRNVSSIGNDIVSV